MTPEGSVFGGERAGGTRGAFDVEERDACSVGRECGRVDVAVELREATRRDCRRDERDRDRAGRPGSAQSERKASEAESGDQARSEALQELAGRGGGDGLAVGEIVDGGDANLAGFEPGDALAVGRDGNLGDGACAVFAGEDFVELSGGWRGCGLRGRGLRVYGEQCERTEKQSAPETARRRALGKC